ncbi:hypothetical protein [Streptomyces sp. SID13726]|uniref:hypothetical protein n=1 Tax=Streptomyces sp. SID13726 TaxID=2706058 RepID=UPI001EF28935|nr:hypothetical protein [Streptomyces sp. SID13726]
MTLREITDRADAVVAAVSYHFGSLKGLCESAIERVMQQHLDARSWPSSPWVSRRRWTSWRTRSPGWCCVR